MAPSMTLCPKQCVLSCVQEEGLGGQQPLLGPLWEVLEKPHASIRVITGAGDPQEASYVYPQDVPPGHPMCLHCTCPKRLASSTSLFLSA